MDILSSILSQKISEKNTKQSDYERIFWFVNLMKWVQRPRSEEEKKSKLESVYTTRLKYLLQQLKNNLDWQEHFVSNVSLLLIKISLDQQLTSAGLSDFSSFSQELIHRIQEKMLPQAPLSDDLETLIYEIFPDEDESHYVDFIDADILEDLFQLFTSDRHLVRRIKSDILSAAYVLSRQVLSDVLIIQRELQDFEVPLVHLNEFRLEDQLRQLMVIQADQVPENLKRDLEQIENHIEQLFLKMKERGVKIELVYLFQVLRRKKRRLDLLLQFLILEVSTIKNFRVFIAQLIIETHHQKSLRGFFSENMMLLTDRIVQSSSQIGEHYVTYTWKDFGKMFYASLGGGAITAFTVLIKQLISSLKLTGFIKGFLESMNYSGSFLVIQFLGLTLATKQPSTTAPYIGLALQKSTTEARKSIVALLRTQFIAVFGNLIMVFPLCFIISWGSFKLGHSFYTHDEALYTFMSTDILGPSAFFAIYTGFLLFFASLLAGWVENWVFVNRIDKRIKYNKRIQKYIGVKRSVALAAFISEKANPLAANIGLGFLLGMTPQIMKFLNIPLEARHVTLSTGGFAASLPVLMSENSFDLLNVMNSAAGILAIGFLNISVSFLLAFVLASVSSKVKFSSFWRLLKSGVWLIFAKPWLLFIPEKNQAQK